MQSVCTHAHPSCLSMAERSSAFVQTLLICINLWHYRKECCPPLEAWPLYRGGLHRVYNPVTRRFTSSAENDYGQSCCIIYVAGVPAVPLIGYARLADIVHRVICHPGAIDRFSDEWLRFDQLLSSRWKFVLFFVFFHVYSYFVSPAEHTQK